MRGVSIPGRQLERAAIRDLTARIAEPGVLGAGIMDDDHHRQSGIMGDSM